MMLLELEQGSPEWFEARAGVITASRVRDALDTLKDGKPSSKSVSYMHEIAMERATGAPADEGFVSWQMRRGTELEPDARMAYEAETGFFVDRSGLALTDDRLFGYSTDGLVGDDGLIEIKCPASPEKLIEIWRTRNVDEYIHQVQAGLWITDRQWCDLTVYAPQLEPVGKDLLVIRIERDEKFIDDMASRLVEFERGVSELAKVLFEPMGYRQERGE